MRKQQAAVHDQVQLEQSQEHPSRSTDRDHRRRRLRNTLTHKPQTAWSGSNPSPACCGAESHASVVRPRPP